MATEVTITNGSLRTGMLDARSLAIGITSDLEYGRITSGEAIRKLTFRAWHVNAYGACNGYSIAYLMMLDDAIKAIKSCEDNRYCNAIDRAYHALRELAGI